MFEVRKQDHKTRARTGRITTPHGAVETPSYVVVGTNAEVRTLEPEDIPKTKTQIIIANTYHLWRELGDEGLSSYPGVHAELGWEGPVMTDSGGFQVFSMGAGREHGVGKIAQLPRSGERPNGHAGEEPVVRVTDAGVYFQTETGDEYLDAETSMKIQEQLGADIVFAFDEPSSPAHDYGYTKRAMERTHRWAERSLEAKASSQKIYGVVQGGRFEDLRRASAQLIGNMPFDGFGIGGSFGNSFGDTKADLWKELDWTIPYLPPQKPRHLLGIGQIDDLFYGVEAGIDTFDCVIPTREARHGGLWTAAGRFDLFKGKYADDGNAIEDECSCPVCFEEPVERRELRKMFKEKNPEAGRLATIHNLFFFNDLMEKMRRAIEEGSFAELKKKYIPAADKR